MSNTIRRTALTAFGAFCLSACGDADTQASANSLPPGGGGGDQGLQTTLADPAPQGETAVASQIIASGLDIPWSIAFLPDGTMLIAERPGTIRVYKDGALAPEPVAGVPDVLVRGQGGMHDILVHPNFEENGVLFLAYAHGAHDSNGLRISRAEFDGQTISNLTVLYDAAPLKDTGHHFGGRLVWGGDGKIYATIGDGGKYKQKAQDYSSSFGAVIRINEDGSIPEDNPTIGDDALLALYSKGHRNAQGLVYDKARDILWSNEHGARGGDEINAVQAGANYGWPAATYGIDYNGARISPFTEFEGTVQPVKYWTPSIAPSGMAVYEGALFEDWSGDLLVGALAGRALHRVIMDGDAPAGEERYLIGERIRDVRVGPDGAIYVASENASNGGEGRIIRLSPADAN